MGQNFRRCWSQSRDRTMTTHNSWILFFTDVSPTAKSAKIPRYTVGTYVLPYCKHTQYVMKVVAYFKGPVADWVGVFLSMSLT